MQENQHLNDNVVSIKTKSEYEIKMMGEERMIILNSKVNLSIKQTLKREEANYALVD